MSEKYKYRVVSAGKWKGANTPTFARLLMISFCVKVSHQLRQGETLVECYEGEGLRALVRIRPGSITTKMWTLPTKLPNWESICEAPPLKEGEGIPPEERSGERRIKQIGKPESPKAVAKRIAAVPKPIEAYMFSEKTILVKFNNGTHFHCRLEGHRSPQHKIRAEFYFDFCSMQLKTTRWYLCRRSLRNACAPWYGCLKKVNAYLGDGDTLLFSYSPEEGWVSTAAWVELTLPLGGDL